MLQTDILAALLAGAVVLAVVPAVKRVAIRVNAVARPKSDRWHNRVVPMLGGVAIFIGVAAGWAVAVPPSRYPLVVLVCGCGMFAVGLFDDLFKLKPTSKLVAQVVIACAVASLGPIPGLSRWVTLNILVGVIWIVGITNALNLLDNMDGLCAGVGAIASVACWMTLFHVSSAFAALAAALFGGTAGFLVYNARPASIFMGDAGSLFVGGMLAITSLVGGSGTGRGLLLTLIVPVFLLLIPIFDTTFVTVSRILSTRSAAQGGKDHTSHRLVALGFSESQAVLVLWGLAAIGGAVAVIAPRVGPVETILIGPLVLIGLALLAVPLARVKVYDGADFSRLIGKAYTPLLVEMAYRRRIFEVILDLLLITFAYVGSYLMRFDRDLPVYYPLIQQSLPAVIACQSVAFFAVGVYRGTWRHVGLTDLSTYGKGIVAAVLGSVMALVLIYHFDGYPRGVFLIDALLLGVLVPGSRVSFRVIADAAGRRRTAGTVALIYGAGDGGALLVRELRNNPSYGLLPVGFVDDDASKLGKSVMRLPVLGGISDLEVLLARERVEVVVVSTRTIAAERLRVARTTCQANAIGLLQMRFSVEPLVDEGPLG